MINNINDANARILELEGYLHGSANTLNKAIDEFSRIENIVTNCDKSGMNVQVVFKLGEVAMGCYLTVKEIEGRNSD